MKLEDLLGAELYAQVQAKLDEVNGNEPDKLKHVRYADLSEGEYVGKGKHDALQAKFDGQTQELAAANELIAKLEKSSKGNETALNQIAEYKTQNEQLQAELAETKLKSAIKVALLSEKAVDVDYLTFKLNEKLKEKGETLELDENDNIKGWDDRLAGLKTQFPTMFESSTRKIIELNKLPDEQNGGTGVSKEQFDKMGYQSRVEFKQNHPEQYSQLTK